MFKVIEKRPPQWLLDDIQKGNDKLKNNYTLKNLITFLELLLNKI